MPYRHKAGIPPYSFRLSPPPDCVSMVLTKRIDVGNVPAGPFFNRSENRSELGGIMETLKKFIRYYSPYKAVFFLDLLCATVISVVDLVYPQLLRSLTGTLFTRDGQTILNALLPIAIGLFLMYLLQSLCKYYVSYQGHMMGANMERDMRQQIGRAHV